MTNANIYICTSNKGLHIVEAFQCLFNKYWGVAQPVTILGWDNKPDFELAPNFKFVSLGEDRGPRIGGALIDFFSGIEEERFIFSVDDQVIIRPVNLPLLDYLANIMTYGDHVGCIQLGGGLETNSPCNCYSTIQESDGFNLVEHSPVSRYKVSAIWAMWAKGYFLKYLSPDMDLWQWENIGSDHAKNDGWQVLATAGRYLLTLCHIYKRGNLHADSFRSWDKFGQEMEEEDQEIVQRIANAPLWVVAGEVVKR